MAVAKCPGCGVEPQPSTLNRTVETSIVSQSEYTVVYCAKCGHTFSVMPWRDMRQLVRSEIEKALKTASLR